MQKHIDKPVVEILYFNCFWLVLMLAIPAIADDKPLLSRRSMGAEASKSFSKPLMRTGVAGGTININQLVEGIDPAARSMTPEEIAKQLNDPLALLILRKAANQPNTLGEILASLDAQGAEPGGVPDQKSFVVAEGGHIPWTPETKDLQRALRLTVVRFKGSNADIMISADTFPTGFLQVLAWDDAKGMFNYYERFAGPTWVWRGDSGHSVAEPTRGKGCFQCHVNGNPNMKELNFPWNNWSSMVAPIPDDVFPPTSALPKDPLLAKKQGAEVLERNVIRPAIHRLNDARFKRPVLDWKEAIPLLRHLFETTTVNLATSSDASRAGTEMVALPTSFFLNKDALFDVLGIDPPDDFQGMAVSRVFYNAALADDKFELVSGTFHQAGDTFFGFMVPESSLEDAEALRQLISRKLVSPKFAACVMVIDFQNPVYSPLRKGLMKYIPSNGPIQGDVSSQLVAAISQAAAGLPEASAEKQFMSNWNLPDQQWKNVFSARIKDYLVATRTKLTNQEGYNAFVRLAESRRREFSASPLSEFDLLLPRTTIPQELLKMNIDGTIGPR